MPMYLSWEKTVQAIHIDANAVRMGTRLVPGLDSAVAAEVMLRRAGIERVGLKIFLSFEQVKVAFRDNQVQIATFATDAAIAFRNLEIGWR